MQIYIFVKLRKYNDTKFIFLNIKTSGFEILCIIFLLKEFYTYSVLRLFYMSSQFHLFFENLLHRSRGLMTISAKSQHSQLCSWVITFFLINQILYQLIFIIFVIYIEFCKLLCNYETHKNFSVIYDFRRF